MTEPAPAIVPSAFPRYQDLAEVGTTGSRHAWGLFGEDDELGSLNWMTPAAVHDAAAEIKEGLVVNLSLPLTLPDPPIVGFRHPLAHHVEVSRMGRDDALDHFYLQGSSQWDGLQHIRFREFGYWGGRQDTELDEGALGISKMAEHGIAGRGVLIDIAAYCARLGRAIDCAQRVPVSCDLLDETLEWEGVQLRPGDVVLVRTGWVGWYLSLATDDREALAGRVTSRENPLEAPGLEAGVETAAWVWDHRVAAIAADNPALEVLPVDPAAGFLHRLLIPLLGVPIGELWALDDLSEACRRRDRYSFFLTSAPLNLPKGVGSPANAYGIL